MDDTRSVVSRTVRDQAFFGGGQAREIAPRTFFAPNFANAAALETHEGLLLVDCGLVITGPSIHAAIRGLSAAPLHTVVFTHGHVDHAFGLQPWLDEGAEPRIVAHRNVVARFHRYRKTAGYNEHINRVQFGLDDARWPTEFFWPDTVYDHALTLTIGGERFELRHGKGETDDATWIWAPERKVLCTGDFWIGCAPNCGNPQKVQRYPEEWVEALEAMAALGAEVLLPGHGQPIEGAGEVRAALTDAAAYLRAIVDQTIEALNAGLPHEQIVRAVRVREDLAAKPYLRAVYDRPEFIVRNLIRRYGGWWSGYPSELMPAAAEDRAREVASLAGGVDRLVSRARELLQTDLPLACHLAEWAALAAPEDPEAQACMGDVFRARAEAEESLMGRGIYMHAVRAASRALRR